MQACKKTFHWNAYFVNQNFADVFQFISIIWTDKLPIPAMTLELMQFSNYLSYLNHE